MRIVIFSNSYKPAVSGVVTSMDVFRRGLIAAGFKVHIIAPDYRDYLDEEPYVFRFPAIDLTDAANIALTMPFKAAMDPTVHGIKPNLIHSQHPILMGDIAAAFARELNVPMVFTFHTRYDEYAQRYVPIIPEIATLLMEEIIKRYLKKCSHIIAPTPHVRDLIYAEYETDVPVSVVPTPVDLDRYAHLDSSYIQGKMNLEKAEILLYVGRLAQEKNLGFLIRSFARIARARPQARLLIVGKGPKLESLEALVAKLRIQKQVIFTGAVPHADIPHYAAAADVFVFPSETETQGLVLIETMAAGTPVVAVKAPASVDVLAEGGGTIVPAEEEEFAQAVINLLENPAHRKALSDDARQAVQRYSLPAASEQMIQVYKETIATRSLK